MSKIFNELLLNDWNDLMGIDILKNILSNMSEKKDIPNLIFHGDTGTGKSLLSRILLKKIYGNIINPDYIMKLSVNDERGINSVREKIKSFSSNQISNNDGMVNFKVILFDQADTLTIDAQNALRRIIETSANLTRFIFLTCNINNIIDPIRSRCLILRIPIINKKTKLDYYRRILDKDNKKVKNSDINKILQICNGDIRMEKNKIELLSNIANTKSNKLLVDEYIFNNFDENYFKEFYKSFMKINNLNEMNKLINENLNKNNHFEILVIKFYEYLLEDKSIEDNKKVYIIQLTHQYNKNLSSGCDTYITILNYFVNIRDILLTT